MTGDLRALGEEQFGELKRAADQVFDIATYFKDYFPALVDWDRIVSLREEIQWGNNVNHTRMAALAYMKPAMVGPTEREFFGQITTLGKEVIEMLTIAGKNPLSKGWDEVVKEKSYLKWKAEIRIKYSDLVKATAALERYFPPVERDGPAR